MLAWKANAVVEELFHCMTIEINVVEAFTHVSLDVTIPFTLIRCRQNSFHNFKNLFSLIFFISPVKLKVQYVSLLQSISLTHMLLPEIHRNTWFASLGSRIQAKILPLFSISLVFYLKHTCVYTHMHTHTYVQCTPIYKIA